MIGSNSRDLVPENGTSSNNFEVIDLEGGPGGMLVQKRDGGGDDGPTIKIKVSYGSAQHDLSVASNSTFGDLKKVIAREIGLDPVAQKVFFRGNEREDQDYLHMAGVKDSSRLLLMEDTSSKDKELEELKETVEISIGGEAVAKVRAEVDKLSEQVSALHAVVSSGTKVDEKDIVYLTEMLMRQLLNLDGIDAKGEGKAQRKMEVRRVQNLVEMMDTIRAKNSNPFVDSSNSVSVTTQWETFDSGVGTINAAAPLPSSTKVTQDWEQFD